MTDEDIRIEREKLMAEPLRPAFMLTRVYPNGDAKQTFRNQSGMLAWVKYNKECRPGCSLFVDYAWVVNGIGFTLGDMDTILDQIAERYPPPITQEGEKCGPQIEKWGLGINVHAWWGWPAEKDIEPFRLPHMS